MGSSWDALVAAFHRGLDQWKFGQAIPQFSYYAQTQQVVLQFDGVSEGHDQADFMDRLSSAGDFWSGQQPQPQYRWPATPTPSELDHGELAYQQWVPLAIGAMGQGSQSIPIGGTSPPPGPGYESAANAWQWEWQWETPPSSIAHPDQSEWHITNPRWGEVNPACWVWEQMLQGRTKDDMRTSLVAIGADDRFAELCLSRITWLQLQQGRKTAPQRLTKWTRNSKDEVWALHALRAQWPFPGRPMAIEDCMNMLLDKPVALATDVFGDLHNVQYVSTFMELSHITLSNIIYILIM